MALRPSTPARSVLSFVTRLRTTGERSAIWGLSAGIFALNSRINSQRLEQLCQIHDDSAHVPNRDRREWVWLIRVIDRKSHLFCPSGAIPHVEGEVNGSLVRDRVARIYNRYEYLEERRAALEKWARRIQIIASGKPAEVVKLLVS